ncbi:hypothetical protein H6G89_12485 [Oscillatoria sp. FACHB-1407]|uniref:hypothetical protein n=1 Tax=Oscillatoria sp. FACHB-1407 TaxID=2692847 RepID=UPI001682326E|nr:hypothetical protein [Oscillatoria sp. FACHB-1407]MBD2461866.1 hypothetical protein [Oscillatoria sp. FACHB-1407]
MTYLMNGMHSINGITIASVTLTAREERSTPRGQVPSGDRDIGFADVFLQLHNARRTHVEVVIQSVEICHACFNVRQMVSQSPQTICLHPMENASVDLHLTNKTGYSRGSRVRAVIRYQVEGQVGVVESEPVAIERW